ncbi:MAG: HD-GYP domain-containing protein [Thermotogota bacterium]
MRLPVRAVLLVCIVSLAAAVALGYSLSVLEPPSPQQLTIFGIFAILAVLAEVYATWIPAYKWEISSSIAIYLSALFILGPNLAIPLVLISSLVSEVLLRTGNRRRGWVDAVAPITFNVCQLVVTVAVAGLLLRAFGRPNLVLADARDYALAVGTFLVYFVVNISLVMGIISLSERKPFWSSLLGSLRQFFVQYVVLCVSALLLAVLYTLSVWHVFLAVFPLFLVHVSFRSYLKLQTEARQTFEKISQLLDARDHYTAVHSTEVADLAVRIGQQLGFGHGDLERIQIAAKVHDIGKVAVPDSILLKPGTLDDEEWAVMKNHPVTSAELISGLEIYSGVADAVRHEHERWDGSGYPDGLVGEQIPMISRVIAAADIYNALVTDRPYRPAFSREETLHMIEEMRGKDLDPAVADALLEVLRKTGIEVAAPVAA